MLTLKALKIGKVPIFALHSTTDVSMRASKVIGASYEGKTNVWYYPAYYPFGGSVFEELMMIFGKEIIIDPSVEKRLGHLATAEKVLQATSLGDFKFATNPMDHQFTDLLKWIIYIRLGIFWECGVGKTKLAVDAVRYLKMNTLYLCPSRLVENTADEMGTHSFDGELDVVSITQKIRREKLDALKHAVTRPGTLPRVVIVGYETASNYDEENEINYYDLLSKFKYDLLICDESHKLRSFKSNVSNITSKLASRAYRRVLMTGTPSLGNPLHLYVQMRILMPWRFANFYSFKNQFVKLNPNDKRMIVGFKNLHILRSQMDTFASQRTKEECLDLPERQVIPIVIPMSAEQLDLYNMVKAGVHTSVSYNPQSALVQQKLHQICGGTLIDSPIDYTICESCPNMMRCIEYNYMPFSKNCLRKDLDRPVTVHTLTDNPKLEYLVEKVENIVHGEGKKVILWYNFKPEKDIIMKRLKSMKIEVVDYEKEGQDGARRFQSSKDGLAFLSQIKRSSGITLTAATYTIYYSMTFDPEDYRQSRDRMYRKGQTKKTIEYHLNMYDSVDEKVSKNLRNKKKVDYAMLGQDLSKEIITDVNMR